MVLSRLPRNALVWLRRLSECIEPFEVCFAQVAQPVRRKMRREALQYLDRSPQLRQELPERSDPEMFPTGSQSDRVERWRRGCAEWHRKKADGYLRAHSVPDLWAHPIRISRPARRG